VKTSLVIPCYRESARLPAFLDELCAEMDRLGGVSVRVVEDGSDPAEAQATCSVVEAARARFQCLEPMLALPENRGKGGAVYAGWDAAPEDAELLAFVDADGSCSARETARLLVNARAAMALAARGEAPAPAIFASRIKMLGRRVERDWRRHLMGRVYATLVSELLRIPVYDSQCGLKLVPAAAYRRIRPELAVTGFSFDAELLARLLAAGVPVREEPIDWFEVPGGKVRMLRDSIRMAADVWRIRKMLRGAR
jgi:dolichyl-phosphate beta-glucosyltransferase